MLKIVLEATWSDTDFEESASTASKDARRQILSYIFENYDDRVVTFGEGSLAHVKGKGSIAIFGCPKLDGILYIEGLKANRLSISQMCDKDHKVNFHQDLCKIVNKEGNVVADY
ncbi:hypothetical protein CK203_042112 [Vitis vinifera]|uniref:Retrovirus-related Pol polyprotein from transposon TNT 1-94-like beta-barrel domain-containing protein n=1 Tax=Vitis vinifera TaxID=29760 RepID=A0A438HHR8_VITVI|nr:hypothetical protein CK203_042112 [Vitis vinifera]